jgi:hypothetical protein
MKRPVQLMVKRSITIPTYREMWMRREQSVWKREKGGRRGRRAAGENTEKEGQQRGFSR